MMTEPHTLREVIEAGERGEFARELLVLYEDPMPRHFRAAYACANTANQFALERAVPSALDVRSCYADILSWYQLWRMTLRREFSGLTHLDEDPESIPMRTPNGGQEA